MPSGYYPESVNPGDPNAPWNEGDTPCDTCEKPPEGFDCHEGENWEKCPRWNPEQPHCIVCDKPISKGFLCKDCKMEEQAAEDVEIDDDWEDEREMSEQLDRTTENECYAVEQGATTEEDIAALFRGSNARRDA